MRVFLVFSYRPPCNERGYYHGEVDGLLGRLTRSALANYQRNNGLHVTSAIDSPTLESFGIT